VYNLAVGPQPGDRPPGGVGDGARHRPEAASAAMASMMTWRDWSGRPSGAASRRSWSDTALSKKSALMTRRLCPSIVTVN
jgi:hypothetical protein